MYLGWVAGSSYKGGDQLYTFADIPIKMECLNIFFSHMNLRFYSKHLAIYEHDANFKLLIFPPYHKIQLSHLQQNHKGV